MQWLNSTGKLPVFVANRFGEILETTTIDEWNHVLSGVNAADTGTRGISLEALKNSSWVIGPSILRTSDLPFIPDKRVINKIRLKGFFGVDNCLETHFPPSPMSHPTNIPNKCSIGKSSVPSRDIKE